MKKRSWIIRGFSSLVIFLAITACVPTVNLSHTELPRSNLLDRVVVVGTINDLRPKSHGGGDFSHLGEVRNTYGMPFQLKTKNGKELDVSLHEAVNAALMNAGYRDANGAEKNNAPRLEIDILEFWCDGYMGYKVNATIVVRLVDAKTGVVIAERKVATSQGFALLTGYGSLYEAFNKVMDQIVSASADFMKTDAVRQSFHPDGISRTQVQPTLEQDDSLEAIKPKASSMKEAKAAYKNGQLTKVEYKSVTVQLKSDYEQKLRQIKLDYMQGNIDKTEYKKRADIARTDYEGSTLKVTDIPSR